MDKDKKILMPIIRQITPELLAADIVGVQPMQGPVGSIFTTKWSLSRAPKYSMAEQYVGNVPTGYTVVNVDREVATWIEGQPLHMWKHGELISMTVFYDQYIISEQLLTWLKMRWE